MTAAIGPGWVRRPEYDRGPYWAWLVRPRGQPLQMVEIHQGNGEVVITNLEAADVATDK